MMTLIKCIEKEKPRSKRIYCKKILVVEGKDECNFFKELIDKLDINGVEIHDAGGKDNFQHRIPALIDARGFDEVEIMGVIRDADDDANQAFNKIKNLINRLKIDGKPLKAPNRNYTFANGSPKIGIYILPGNSKNGMLEDLCLSTVKEHSIMEHVESYTTTATTIPECCPKNHSKTKTQVFLAAMPKIACSAGLGATMNYWDLDSDELDELKEFLENMR